MRRGFALFVALACAWMPGASSTAGVVGNVPAPILAAGTALAGMPPMDCDVCPFALHDEIEKVEAVLTSANSRYHVPVVAGARITVRAAPGLTAEYFRQVVNFHLACPEAADHQRSWRTSCPLGVGTMIVEICPFGDGFAVEIRSNDRFVAAEILARAKDLVRRTGSKVGCRAESFAQRPEEALRDDRETTILSLVDRIRRPGPSGWNLKGAGAVAIVTQRS